MMTSPAGPTPTNEGITWREARYVARVVQMLVTSPNDRAEFRRELEHLLRAAEALRTASVQGNGRASREHRDSEAELAAEDAVVELWRSHAAAGYDRQPGASVIELRRSPPLDPVDETELAHAVDEIERAAAVLRAEERAAALAAAQAKLRARAQTQARAQADPSHGWPTMKEQMIEFWLPVAAATVGLLAAVVSFIR